MANRLVRYDALLLRRAVTDGFRGPVDLVLLLAMAALAVAWLRARLGEVALPPEAAWLAMLAGPAGVACQRLARRRLDWLAEHSPVAPMAVAPESRRAYVTLAHAVAGAGAFAAAVLLGMTAGRPVLAAGVTVLAYGAGAVLARFVPGFRRRRAAAAPAVATQALGGPRAAVLRLVLRRQGFGPGNALIGAGLLLGASFALTLAAGWWGEGRPEALRFALLLAPSLVLLLFAARLDPGLLAFLPAAGFRPGFIALAVAALPLASLLTAGAAMLATGASPGVLVALALGHLGFVLVAVARAWLYPGRAARSVEFQVQIEAAGIALAAFLLPPLALAALLRRFARFHRHCRDQHWRQG